MKANNKTKLKKYKSPEDSLKEKMLDLFEWYNKEKLKEQKLKTIKF
jgi:hypothetical protein